MAEEHIKARGSHRHTGQSVAICGLSHLALRRHPLIRVSMAAILGSHGPHSCSGWGGHGGLSCSRAKAGGRSRAFDTARGLVDRASTGQGCWGFQGQQWPFHVGSVGGHVVCVLCAARQTHQGAGATRPEGLEWGSARAVGVHLGCVAGLELD